MNRPRILFRAAGIADAAGVRAAPGAIAIEGHRVIAAGSPEAVGTVADAIVRDLPDRVLIPGLVNAHAHLDLSHLGPQPYAGDFISWVTTLRESRAVDDEAAAASVRRGIELAHRGGTVLIGDIAGVRSTVPFDILRKAGPAVGLGGVSFLEIFGIGRSQAVAASFIQTMAERFGSEGGTVRFGLQPHAPYSCGLDVYRAAARTGLPLATHLAETHAEIEIIRDGTGPLVDMLRAFGVWDASIRPAHQHPVKWLSSVLEHAPFIAAHLNYVDDMHINALARWPITVAYCPRASAYFQHDQPHRYRHMMDAGINVALGTDSIVCLDTPDRLSPLDEMRLLYRRDNVDALRLLHMATRAGARALGENEDSVTFRPGPVRGIVGVPVNPHSTIDPLHQVLERDDAPQWILPPAATEEEAS